MSQRGAQKAGFFNCRPQFAIDATADLLLLHGFLLGLMIRITLAFLAPFLALQVASSHLGSTSLMFFRNGPGFTSSLVPKPRPKTVQWSLLIAWLYWVRCTGFRVDLGKLCPPASRGREHLLEWWEEGDGAAGASRARSARIAKQDVETWQKVGCYTLASKSWVWMMLLQSLCADLPGPGSLNFGLLHAWG